MSRRWRTLIGWLGFSLVCLVLILVSVQPGIVRGLLWPSGQVSTQTATSTKTAEAESTRPPAVTRAPTTWATPSEAATPTPAATAAAPVVTAPAQTTASPAALPTTAKPTAKPTPTRAPAPVSPTPATTAGSSGSPVNASESESGPSRLAECCGGNPAPLPLTPQKPIARARIASGRQTATLTLDSYGYSPAILVVERGVPTTLSFDMKRADTCNDQLWFSLLDRKVNLAGGEKVPTFKPEEDFAFSCWMGMQGVYVKVVDKLAEADLEQIEIEVANLYTEGGVACH